MKWRAERDFFDYRRSLTPPPLSVESPPPSPYGDRACTRRRHRRRHLSKSLNCTPPATIPCTPVISCPLSQGCKKYKCSPLLSWTPGGPRRRGRPCFFLPWSRCQRRSVWRCFASKACAAPSSSERLALQHRRGRWAMLLFAFPAGPSVQVVLTKVLRVDIGVRRGLSNRLISETAASSSARRPPCSASPAP